jgi:hypothetical protein
MDHLLEIELEVNGSKVKALVDSGAQGNFISPKVVNRERVPWKNKKEPYQLLTIEGNEVSYDDGVIHRETEQLQVRYQQKDMVFSMDITGISHHDAVLGLPWLRKYNPDVDWVTGQLRWRTTTPSQDTTHIEKLKNLASENVDGPHSSKLRETPKIIAVLKEPRKEQENSIPEEYQQYWKLFQPELETGLPEHGPWDHEIPLKEGTHPHFMKIYGLSEDKLKVLREYLDENLRKGYIRQSTSPAGYPLLFVPKKSADGTKKWRPCIDYRRLNEITIKNRAPLPLISEMRDRLRKAQWFTALDLRGAYNLIRIKEGEEWKTAFRTRYGHYEYLVMPFGLTNAPASFQTRIDNVLREHLDDFVFAYLDDILVYSETIEEHKRHVHKVLAKLQEAKMLVEASKSRFHVQEVDFLGCTMEPGKIRMQESKIQAIKEWPTPTTVTDVRSFLGFVNFYRKFIEGYGKRAQPLTDLTKKDLKFDWTQSCQDAFEEIKQEVLRRPILWEPDPSEPYEVEADASGYAIGGQLLQRDKEGRPHPIAFFSKKLHGAELNYPVYDKELMAIVEAFKEWKVYLIGARHPITVYSDHRNLTYFTTTQELSGRQARWSQFLSEFDFRIEYRKGSQNLRADALSRRPDHKESKDPTPTTMFREHDGTLQLNATFRVLETYQTQEEYHGRKLLRGTQLEQTVTRIHESPQGGHRGVASTLQLVRQHYDAPGLLKTVKRVIERCDTCHKIRNPRHKTYGQLQTLPLPDKPWQSISWDLITKLPLSKEPVTHTKYDSILVVVDRLTKYAKFIPFKEAHTAEELAEVFLKYVVADHGVPEEIVSDRGTTFTSKFWTSLTEQLKIKRKLSTAYHPQTDGQTERTNQTLEQYLRGYINYPQDDWVTLLPLAQICYNSASTGTTGVSPFFANYGMEPTFRYEPGGTNPAATVKAEQLQIIHEQLKMDLQFVQARMTAYANKTRMKGPSLKEGDKVYLLRRNIKTNRPNDKLDYRKIGPFKIKNTTKNPTVFELSLPKKMNIHPRFHISMLELAHPDTPEEESIEVQPEEEYEVEEIRDHRGQKGHEEYLVKWKNYNEHESTWEPIKNLRNSQRLLQHYHQQLGTPRRNQ